MKDPVLSEAKRLWDMGLAILWIHPKSKRPVETGWTTGPRYEWEYLRKTYRPGMNVGVRPGEVSHLPGLGYLACIDVDVVDPAFRSVAVKRARELTGGALCPEVRSGSGNGSRHLYCVTEKPFQMLTLEKHHGVDQAGKKVKHWEICVYSTSRQMVLPPSIHPDTGRAYAWRVPLTDGADLPLLRFDEPSQAKAAVPGEAREPRGDVLQDFEALTVDVGWLPISEEMRAAIVSGEGVTDRSGYILRAASALVSAGLTQNEVLSVLTDPETYLGECAYDHAKTRSRARAAAWVYRYTLAKVERERSGEGVFATPAVKSRKLTPEEAAAQGADLNEDRDWRQDILRGGGSAPLKLVQNVVTIITHAVGADVIKRDEFSYRDTYTYDTPWGGREGQAVSDDDVAVLKHWLGEQYGFEPNDNTISDGLIVLAKRNAYDPVKDLIEGLPLWDGNPRLDTWLADHFEAKGDREYLAQVFRKWMFAMVLRVYEPGAKFDWMPIFEGAQGIGKSSFGKILVGDKYFLDWLPNLNDKDSALSLQGMWGVEMGELSQFRRNELENIKAFLTRTVDKLRPPYGRRLIESPRRCVFFGTTNRKTYLTDETGNRRFKPVVVGNLDFKALRRDRLQLFAEARVLYTEKRETNETLELTGNARIYERQIHSEKMVEDDSNSMEEAMQDFIQKVTEKRVSFDLEKFRILDLFEGAGPLAKWKPENRNVQFASKMLKRMGGEMRKIHGMRYWKVGQGAGIHTTTRHPTLM